MTAPAHTEQDIHTARFVDDMELRRRLAPTMGRDRFIAWIRVLEGRGFPAINRECGLRDFKKVEAWLDDPDRNRTHAGIEEAEDGAETFDATTNKQGSRAQDRAHVSERREAPLLVRAQRRA